MADEQDKGAQTPVDSTTPPAPTVPAVPEGSVVVPMADLVKLQESLADLEKRDADREAEMAGIRAIAEEAKGASASGDGKLRERQTFEPKFRTVRLRKFPIAGDITNVGYVVGWTDRGAYQMVDRTGVTPQVVDYIDIIFLDHERNADGVLQAERVKLLDLLNSEQVHCKIVNTKSEVRKVPTGEEIDVSVWDNQHGLVATGDKVDGYSAFTDIEYTIEIPGHSGQVQIDALYCN